MGNLVNVRIGVFFPTFLKYIFSLSFSIVELKLNYYYALNELALTGFGKISSLAFRSTDLYETWTCNHFSVILFLSCIQIIWISMFMFGVQVYTIAQFEVIYQFLFVLYYITYCTRGSKSQYFTLNICHRRQTQSS